MLWLLAGEALPWEGVTCQWETKKVMFRHSLSGTSVKSLTSFAQTLPLTCQGGGFFQALFQNSFVSATLYDRGFRALVSGGFHVFILLPVAPKTTGFVH